MNTYTITYKSNGEIWYVRRDLELADDLSDNVEFNSKEEALQACVDFKKSAPYFNEEYDRLIVEEL